MYLAHAISFFYFNCLNHIAKGCCVIRGEQTASALESNLTSLERKLDDFLASFEESERQRAEAVAGNATRGQEDGKKS
jgi:hypothetical protein